MSEPVNLFQQTRKHIKTGNLTFLSKQVTAWQKLTKLIQPLLPQPEQWQVVCYQYGILTITGENRAMISQLGYLQKQYIAQLSELDELRPTKTPSSFENPLSNTAKIQSLSRSLSAETQD